MYMLYQSIVRYMYERCWRKRRYVVMLVVTDMTITKIAVK